MLEPSKHRYIIVIPPYERCYIQRCDSNGTLPTSELQRLIGGFPVLARTELTADCITEKGVEPALLYGQDSIWEAQPINKRATELAYRDLNGTAILMGTRAASGALIGLPWDCVKRISDERGLRATENVNQDARRARWNEGRKRRK